MESVARGLAKSLLGFLCGVESLDGGSDVIFGAPQGFLRRSHDFRRCGDRREPHALCI
jgi:hypothetical protein